MRVSAPHEPIEAAPGGVVRCRLEVLNDGASPASYELHLHGLEWTGGAVTVTGEIVPPGAAVEIEVELTVPETFGAGSHLVALEVRSDVPGEVPVVAPITVSVGTLDQLVVNIVPSVIREGRRARFAVEVINRRAVSTEVELFADGADLSIHLAQRRLRLARGQRAVIHGKVRGPKHVVGDSIQRVLTVEARGASNPAYATASFQQRPSIPRPLRAGLVATSILLVWALIAGAAVLWWWNRDGEDDPTAAASTTVVEGAAQPAEQGAPGATTAPGGEGQDTGTATPGAEGTPAAGETPPAGGGEAGGAGATPAPPAAPTTIVRGQVTAGNTGADDGVLVQLTPVTADQQTAATLRRAGGGESARLPGSADGLVKRWPARAATYDSAAVSNMRTLSVSTMNTERDGSWEFHGVPLQRTFEVSLSKPGWETQSFIVSTSEGQPVDLAIDLEPGTGSMSGQVLGGGGGLGGVKLEITDGALTFETTTSTDAANRGQWSVDRLSTPGVYTITASRDGYGTEVMQVRLDVDEQRTGVDLRMDSGVGSISGTVRAGATLGGVTLTAAAGDVTATTTSLTEGAVGTYNFPGLTLGQTYTITAAADGYITQTRRLALTGNLTGVDFEMVPTTATVIGRVYSFDPQTPGVAPVPLPNAGVTVAANALEVRAASAASGDPGAFRLGDLPPGTYLLTLARYDHAPVSQTIDLVAGQVLDIGEVVLTKLPATPLPATGSLVIRTFDSFGRNLTAAAVQLIDIGGRIPTRVLRMSDQENSVEFTQIPIGTYRIEVTKQSFQPSVIERLSIGTGPLERSVTLFKFGAARGSVMNAIAGVPPTHTIPLLDSLGNQVFEAAGELVYFDPELTIPLNTIVPALSCFNVPGQGCFAPVEAYKDTTGKLVVRYELTDTGPVIHVRDTNADNVPDQQLAEALEDVGNEPLDDYQILLYRIEGAVRLCMAVLDVPDGTFQWKADALLQLPAAAYVLRFTPAPGDTNSLCAGKGRLPAGYAQIPLARDDGDVADFVIPAGLDEVVVVDPTGVAPYPVITGTILVPHVGGGGTTTFADFPTAQANGLAVTLACPGGTQTAALSDVGGEVTFTLTQLQTAAIGGPAIDLTGSLTPCQFRAAYADTSEYFPAELELEWRVGFPDDLSVVPPVAIPVPDPDLDISAALVEEPTVVTGRVRWKDLGATGSEPPDYPLDGAQVEVPSAIVGYEPSTQGDPTPITVPPTSPLTQIAGSAGQWAFAVDGERQLIGTATYNFTHPAADPGSITVAADGNGWTPAAVAPTQITDNGSSVDVFLPPRPGVLSGRLDIDTRRPEATAYDEVTFTADAPGTCDGTIPLVRAWTKNPACAGTWDLTYAGDNANLALFSGPSNQRVLVRPTAPAPAQPVRFVDLGQVEVRMTNQLGGNIDSTELTATLSTTDGRGMFPAAYVPTPLSPRAGLVTFNAVPVLAADHFADVQYTMSIASTSYSVAEATWQVYDVTNGTPLLLFSGSGPIVANPNPFVVTDLPIDAGARLRIDMTVPARGTVVGTIEGLQTPPNVPEIRQPLTVPTQATVTAQLLDVAGNPICPPAPEACPILGTPGTGGIGYRLVVAAPGIYDITYAAPGYHSVTIRRTLDPAQTITENQVLRLIGNTVAISARASDAPGAGPVTNVDTRLYWGSIPGLPAPSVTAAYQNPTDAAGNVSFADVTPGTYTLVMRRLDGSGRDTAFPVIGTIVVAAPPAAGVTFTAIMPPVNGSIAGTVNALNSLNHPVPVPPAAIVERAYRVQGTNTGGEAVMVDPPATELPLTETTAGGGAPYLFDGLPFGVHDLKFSNHTADGYTNPADLPVTVAGDETGENATYRAVDVGVSLRVQDSGGAAVIGATASITLIGSNPPQTYSLTDADNDGTYTANAVAPEVVQYRLNVGGANFTSFTRDVTISPSAGVVVIGPAVVNPAADVTGVVQRLDTQTGPPAAFAGIPVELRQGSAPLDPPVITTTGADGSFTLKAATTGSYTVAVTQPGYRPDSTPVNVTAVGVGATFNAGTLTLVKLAQVTFTVPSAVTVSSPGLTPNVTTGTPTSTFQFTDLDPDITYTFTAAGAGYVTQTRAINPDVGAVISDSFVWRQVTVSFSGGTPLTVAVTTGGIPVTVTPQVSGASLVYQVVPNTAYDFTASGGGLVTQVWNLTAGTAAATHTFTWLSIAVSLFGAPGVNDTAVAVSPAATVTRNSATSFTVSGLAPSQAYTLTATGTGLVTQPVTVNLGTASTTQTITWHSRTVTLAGIGTATGTALTVTLPPGASGAPGITKTAGSQALFTITGLRPGLTYTVNATGTGIDTQSVSTGNVTADGSLVISWGTATGTPTNILAGVTVYLCPSASCDTAAESTVRAPQNVSATAPSYSFTGLAPGTYVVGGVRSDDAKVEQSFTVTATGSIDVPSGGSLNLAFPTPPPPPPPVTT